jgi:flagellar hook protein FlgE
MAIGIIAAKQGCMALILQISGKKCVHQAINAGLKILVALVFILFQPVVFGQIGTNIGNSPDLRFVIDGPGYFMVKDSYVGVSYATRYGAFSRDPNGYLVNQAGFRVQGFNDAVFDTIGDVKIDSTGSPNPYVWMIDYKINTNGLITVRMSDGSSFARSQLLLQNFQNPSDLKRVGDQVSIWTSNAIPLAQPVPPGSSGTGFLIQGKVETLVPKLQISRYYGPTTNFSKGILTPTGYNTDIGIEGEGFFVVRRTNDNALFATRAGGFYTDGEGYLVHYSGMRLQGYTDDALTTMGDVQIDAQYTPSGSGNATPLLVVYFYIDRYGNIIEVLQNGVRFVRGQVLLLGCTNTDLIVRKPFDLYAITNNTGLWLSPAQPETDGTGWLVSGALEVGQFDTNLLFVRNNLIFFGQGFLQISSRASDLAISGNGYFTLRNPVSGELYATRLGAFLLDSSGQIISPQGYRLQGKNEVNINHYGDITIDANGAPGSTAPVASFTIDAVGRINLKLADGTQFIRGQVLLQTYRNLQALKPFGNSLYSNVTAALPIVTNGVDGYPQPGNIQQGALEIIPGPPLPLQLPPSHGFRIFMDNLLTTGNATLEKSGDMLQWLPIMVVTGSDVNQAEYFDTNETNQSFYRVKITP